MKTIRDDLFKVRFELCVAVRSTIKCVCVYVFFILTASLGCYFQGNIFKKKQPVYWF